ncbi:MAG: NAD(P)H-hydrate dehydratase [Nautiliaceae bacterium]
MRPVYKEVYSLDKKCYDKYNLTEDILMEHAAYEMALEIYKRFPKFSTINIVAGPGNNGADGITLGRILHGDYFVNLYLPLGAKSGMCKLQLERFKAVGGRVKKECERGDVIVDAIFGSGLKRDLPGEIVSLIRKMNKAKAFKIACDIPTGLDDKGNLRPVAFMADLTVTMGAEKLSLYSDFAKDYVGEIKVANLGVSFNKYKGPTKYHILQKEDLILPIRRVKNAHKRTFGHLGVLVGEKAGAGIMAAMAAFNFGVGLVSVVSHNENINIPYEIMHSHHIENFTALAFGMGLNNHFDDEMERILALDIPMVIDADMFYKDVIKEFLKKEKIVLIPHPKEFASLLKILGFGEYSVKDVQLNRFELAEMFSNNYPNVVLLLKGANKIIAYKGNLIIDPNGSVALAKGGSGDVLAGMIGSLLAQKWHPLKATIHASLAHSIAGDYKPNYALTPLKLIKRLENLA